MAFSSPGWGLSCTGDSTKEMAKSAVQLLTDEESRLQMSARQRKEINKYAARDIVEYVITHA